MVAGGGGWWWQGGRVVAGGEGRVRGRGIIACDDRVPQ